MSFAAGALGGNEVNNCFGGVLVDPNPPDPREVDGNFFVSSMRGVDADSKISCATAWW